MSILPSCSYYLRRLLKRTLAQRTYATTDLLEASGIHCQSLEQRLRHLYPNNLANLTVTLHLEGLITSHQQAQSRRNEAALEKITQQMLWWLGYGINTVSTQPKVFIVDDTIEILQLVTAILSTQGYQVNSALNGQLALTQIPAQSPDLILLDLNLPDVDGVQVYRQLQSSPQTADIPVIFISGKEQPYQSELRDFPNSNYIFKPFKPNTLIERIQSIFDGQSSDLGPSLDVFEAELQQREQQALEKLANSQLCVNEGALEQYFFRATLEGRYLRVGKKLARLLGYASSEEMISQVTDLWEQIYLNPDRRAQWHQCLHAPNTLKTWVTQVSTREHGLINLEEQVCVVEDEFQQPLLFQGCIKPLL